MTKRPKDKNPAIPNKSPSITIRGEVSSFEGPIPSPEALEYYNRLVPDAAERILSLAESEAVHRRSMETRKLELASAQIQRGQWFGLVFGLAALTVVGVAVYHQTPWVAGILGSTTIVAVVTAFVLGRQPTPATKDKGVINS